MSKSKKVRYIKEMEERNAFIIFVSCTLYALLYLFAKSFNPNQITEFIRIIFNLFFYASLIVIFIILIFLIFRIIKVNIIAKERKKEIKQ